MLALAFLLFQQPSIQQLDQLAKARDVEGLTKYLVNVPEHNPFNVLRTGGAYAAGQRGWTVKPLTTPDGVKYVVFSTPIIVEDMGELLFKVDRTGKLVYVPESDSYGVSLDHHDFDVRFDLAKSLLIASDDIQCHWDGRPRKHFFFRISPTYIVRSMVDDLARPVPYKQAGGIVAVAPRTAKLRFHVAYDGTDIEPGFTQRFGPREATLSGSVWYLSIAREPATYDITMHAPTSWTSLAQGDLISDGISGNERITKFHNDVPVVWFSASEGPYKTVVNKIGGREYATMSQTMTADQMRVQNLMNSEVVDFYSSHFVPYPFKRWTSLDSTQFHGGPGALEAYSFATYPGGLPVQDSHEPSHTWWGGILNNNYLQSLWNESFADFSQGLFARNRATGNSDELRHAFVSFPFTTPAYNDAPLSKSGDEIGPEAAALGYGKGAAVLQMLEDEIGTDMMVHCMSEWVRTNPSRHIGSWEDFEKVVDRITGKDYTWFFDEWVRRPGYPTLSLSDVAWKDGRLSGKIDFTGDVYRIDADILMRMPDGSDKVGRIDTLENKDGRFTVACPEKPALVAIDPWSKVLRARDDSESSVSISSLPLYEFKTYVDPTHPDYMRRLRGGSLLSEPPADLSDTILVGSPESVPAMKPLCDKVGFKVSSKTLTYDGTKVDLDHGGAVAVVGLPNGKTCVIALGKCVLPIEWGRARLLVFDLYGRPIRAKTDPVTVGPLTYRFPQ